MNDRILTDDDLPAGARTIARDRDGAPVHVAIDEPCEVLGLPCRRGTDLRIDAGRPAELTLDRDVQLTLDDNTTVVAAGDTRVWLSGRGAPTRFTPARVVWLGDRAFAPGHPVDVFYRGGRLAQPWFIDEIMLPEGTELRDDPDALDLVEATLHRGVEIGRHQFGPDTVLHLRKASRVGVTGRLVVWLTDLWNRSAVNPAGAENLPRLRGLAWLSQPHVFDGEVVDAERRVGLTYDERILVLGDPSAGEPTWWEAKGPASLTAHDPA